MITSPKSLSFCYQMVLLRTISVVLFFGIVGCNDGQKMKVSNTEKDEEIYKIRLKDLKDQPINLETYKGKTIFINFWATWCKPCIEEMPSIEKAQNILQNKEVVFLLASNESVEEIVDFRVNHTYKFNYVRIENLEELNIQALPTTFIINSKGNLVFSEMGSRKWDDSNNINMILKITKNDD